jgi:hypothetical protein
VICKAKRSVGLGLEIELGTDMDASRPVTDALFFRRPSQSLTFTPSQAFDSLNSLRSCKMMHQPNFVIDPMRRAKMILRSERDDIHDVFNHDLSVPLPDECKADKDLLAFQYHIINLRPKAEHASASKFSSIKKMIKSSTEV